VQGTRSTAHDIVAGVSMDVLFAGVPVAGFAAAVDWYTQLFGRPADIVAHDTEVMWRVVGDGWIYVVEDADRAGRALVTIAVPDLEAAVDDVRARGIDPTPIEPVGASGLKSTMADPDGNTISLIEVRNA